MDSRLYQKGIVCCLLMLCVSVARSQTPEQWRDSLSVLNRQIAQSAWSADLHLRKAAVNLELQQWQYATDEYSLILRHEPDNLAALFYRAYANTHLRRYDLAKNDYEDLLKVVPQHLEARLGLSYVHQQTGHRLEALDQLNYIVEQYPDSAIAFAARASLEKDMKQYDASLYDWEQAARLAPANTDYVVSRVDVLLLLGRSAEAHAVLDEAVRRGVPRGMLREWYDRLKQKH